MTDAGFQRFAARQSGAPAPSTNHADVLAVFGQAIASLEVGA